MALLLAFVVIGRGGHLASASGSDVILTVNSLDDTDSPDPVLTFREALLIATGSLLGGLTPGEQGQAQNCVFNGAGDVVGGCGAGIRESIRFAASLGTAPVIHLTSPLPVIGDTAGISIDGAGVLPVIDAAAIGSGNDALVITSANNTVGSLSVINSPRDGVNISGASNALFALGLSGNVRHGVLIAGGSGNQVQNSAIGLLTAADATCGHGNGESGVYVTGAAQATLVTGSTIGCNGRDGVTFDGARNNFVHTNFIGVSATGARLANGYGVAAFGAASGNQIGPAGAGLANVISGNTNAGVYLLGAGTTGNTVIGNLIGLKPGGTAAAGNGAAGVQVSAGASGNTVRDNVISGNTREGVLIEGVAATVAAGNRIGTNGAGVGAVPNGLEGVVLQSGATGSTIGGTAAADRNTISGNTNAGVVIRDAATANNLVEGNNIGIDVSGTARLANGQAGVAIFEAAGNVVGGDGSDIIQFISGNTREGVYVENANGTRIGSSNAIGTGWNLSATIGNTREGVLISGASDVVAKPGLVAGNGLAGMALVGASAAGNILAPYLSGANGGLPVDLNNNGATVNDTGDPDTGPNGLLNYPVITSRSGGTVSGTTCADCTVLVYAAYANPAANGGKAEFLLQVTASGAGAWSASIPAGVPLSDITAMACTGACTAGSATSEFTPVTAVAQVRTIEFAVDASAVAEGGTVQVQVRLTTSDGLPSAAGATVQFATANGTATSGSDYTAKTGTISFLGGAANGETRNISIVTLSDSVDDAGETFTITLTSPSNARLGDLVTHTVTIGLPGSGLPTRATVPLLAKDN